MKVGRVLGVIGEDGIEGSMVRGSPVAGGADGLSMGMIRMRGFN